MKQSYTLFARCLLSVLFISGYGWVINSVLKAGSFSPDVKEVLLFLLGALTASVLTIVAYWFGSTQGSSDKTALLGKE